MLALRIIKGVVVRFILIEISETSMDMKKRQNSVRKDTVLHRDREKDDGVLFWGCIKRLAASTVS